jgi:hypothetical protein
VTIEALKAGRYATTRISLGGTGADVMYPGGAAFAASLVSQTSAADKRAKANKHRPMSRSCRGGITIGLSS